MRRHISVGLILAGAVALIAVATPVMASPVMPTPLAPPATVPATEVAKRLNNLKSHGASEIDRRLAALKDVANDLADSRVMAAGDKAGLSEQIDAESKALIALKSKLAAETDLTLARKDADGIVTDYGVYGLLIPKVRLAIAADRLELATTALDDTVRLANLKIKQAGANGAIDRTTALASARDVVTLKLTSAKAQYVGTSGKVRELTGDYATQQIALAAMVASLKAARADLTAARAAGTDMLAATDSLSSN